MGTRISAFVASFALLLLLSTAVAHSSGLNANADITLSWSSSSLVTNNTPGSNTIGRLYLRADSLNALRAFRITLHWTPTAIANSSYSVTGYGAPASSGCTWVLRGTTTVIQGTTDSTITLAVNATSPTTCFTGNLGYVDFANADSDSVYQGAFEVAFAEFMDSTNTLDTLAAGARATVRSDTSTPAPVVTGLSSTYGWAGVANNYTLEGYNFTDSLRIAAVNADTALAATVGTVTPLGAEYSLTFADGDTGLWNLEVANGQSAVTVLYNRLHVVQVPTDSLALGSGAGTSGACLEFDSSVPPLLTTTKGYTSSIYADNADQARQLLISAGVRRALSLWPDPEPQPTTLRRADGTTVRLKDFSRYYELAFDSPEACERGVVELSRSPLLKRIIQRHRENMGGITCINCPTPPPTGNTLSNDPNLVNTDNMSEPQWYLYNQRLVDEDIQATCAWQNYHFTRGNSAVTIGILDTGIDEGHPDLQVIYSNTSWGRKVKGGRNFTREDGGDSTKFQDNFGHGTHMAGVAAARTNNGATYGVDWDHPNPRGIAGVAGGFQTVDEPDSAGARILCVKVLDDTNYQDSVAVFTKGITYAVLKGARVLNMSFAGYGGTLPWSVDFDFRDAIYNAVAAGAICIAGSGNTDDSTAWYPARFAEWGLVTAVGGTDIIGRRFSNTCDLLGLPGAGSTYGSWVDLVAPGYHMYTTQPRQHYVPVDGFADLGFGMGLAGTSYSAALVSGAAAVLLGMNPGFRDNDITNILEATTFSGCEYRPYVGAGRLDLCKATDLVKGRTLQSGTKSTPNRLIAQGNVTLNLKATDDLGLADSSYAAQRFEAVYNVTFPKAFEPAGPLPLTWVRMLGTAGWPRNDASPYHSFNYGWGKVISDSTRHTKAEYHSYLYYIPSLSRWVPADSAHATLEWAALGDTSTIVTGVGNRPGVAFSARVIGTPSTPGVPVRFAITALPFEQVSAEIVDVAGRLVRRLTDHLTDGTGQLTIVWAKTDDHGVSTRPGVYFCRLRGMSGSRTVRAVIVGR